MNDLIEEISMGPFGSDIKVDSFVDSGVPVLNGANVSGVKLIENSFNYVSEEKAKSLKKANAKRGDIVVTHRGTLGQISYIPNDSLFENYVISQSQFRVRLKRALVDPRYFTYYFHTEEGQQRLLSFKNHVGVPALAQATTNFRLLEFPLIPLEEQIRIADFLTALDSKISLNNRTNAELEAMAKTIYDYWFVQFDFPSPSPLGRAGVGSPYKSSGGKMVWSEELKREIPEGWERSNFGSYAKTRGGFAFKSEWWTDVGLPVIKIKDINEDYTLSMEGCSYVSEDKYDRAKNYEAFPGDVVIAMTGATVGKYAIVPKVDKKILVNQRVGLFNLGKEPLLHLPFLINSLNQKYFRETVFVLASGAAQPNISSDQIDSIPLILPPKDLIKSFNIQLSSLYEKILNNKQQNQKLTELRDWLLPMLMNGQIKIKDVEQELAMAAEPKVNYMRK